MASVEYYKIEENKNVGTDWMDPGLRIIIQYRTDKICRKFEQYCLTNTLEFFI